MHRSSYQRTSRNSSYKNSRSNRSYHSDRRQSYRSYPEIPDFNIENEIFQVLTAKIYSTYEEKKQSDTEYHRKLTLLNTIEQALIEKGIQAMLPKKVTFERLLPYGSAVTRLASQSSDTDLCMAIKGEKGAVSEKIVLQWVIDTFTAHSPFNESCEFKLFSNNQVNFIRISGETLKIDLSISINLRPPVNFGSVQLFNAYSQYSINLLVAQFLQHYGFLPLLHKEKPGMFDPKRARWQNVTSWRVNFEPLSQNEIRQYYQDKNINRDCSVGKMFVGFLNYYTQMVSLSREILVTVNGKIKPKNFEWTDENSLVILDLFGRNTAGKMIQNVKRLVEGFHNAFVAIARSETRANVLENFSNVKINYVKKKKSSFQQCQNYRVVQIPCPPTSAHEK